MRRNLFFIYVFISLSLFLNVAKSQSDPFTYAITSVSKGGTEWIALRKLDTRTGMAGDMLLNLRDKDQQPGYGSSVAAIAFDSRKNRLYYAPMSNDQLRYIDLSTMEIKTIPDQYFSKAGKYNIKNDGPISRMVIAPDDYGYTVTNDGYHLIRFTTNGSPVLTDMGELLDDPQNKEMSIHSACTNSGGDLVADDAGHLYLITGSNKVYKVDIASRTTSYLATISGLPVKFTTSGAAVSQDGKELLISSSVYADGYFKVDPDTWTASSALTSQGGYETADLASSNVLFTKTNTGSGLFISKSQGYLKKIRIYPNPVMEDVVSIQFNDLPAGNYTIQMANFLGKVLMQQKANISGQSQTVIMHIPGYTLQGFYYIRVLDEKNIAVGLEKLAVERW